MALTRRGVLAGTATLAAAPARAQTPAKVTISQAPLIANYTPVYLAQQRGLFAQQGLDVDISTAGGIAVMGDHVASREVLGYPIHCAGSLYDPNTVWLGSFALMAMALAMDAAVTFLQAGLSWD